MTKKLRGLGLLLLAVITVYGCSASSQAVKRGDELLLTKNYYGASIEYLSALSLESDNKDAKLKLCQVSKQAYEQKLAIAENFEKSTEYANALSEYKDIASLIDKINANNCLNFTPVNAKKKTEEMKLAISEKYYKEAEHAFGSENYSGAIDIYKQALQHNNPYKDCKDKIAESYYRIATKLLAQEKLRDAVLNFMYADNAVDGYKDARTLVNKYKAVADEKDADRHYREGVDLATAQKYRDAANEFKSATSFVPVYKDAKELMSKYKTMADEKDAQTHYNKAVELAKADNFRTASEEFQTVTSFVADFKDAKSLASKYKNMADEKDALDHYEKGKMFMSQNDFQSAEKEFISSNNYIQGYKDALALAEKAKNAMPNESQMASAVERALGQEIPVSWVGNLMGGRGAKLSTVEVVRIGIYNDRQRYWPMQIHVIGRCLLNDPFNQNKVVSFDKVGDFAFYRDDYGTWQASMQGGMFQ